jgi:hypothetical protein
MSTAEMARTMGVLRLKAVLAFFSKTIVVSYRHPVLSMR